METIVPYTAKSFLVIGDTKPHKDFFKDNGGKFGSSFKVNDKPTCGWVFSLRQKEKILSYIESLNDYTKIATFIDTYMFDTSYFKQEKLTEIIKSIFDEAEKATTPDQITDLLISHTMWPKYIDVGACKQTFEENVREFTQLFIKLYCSTTRGQNSTLSQQ